MRDGFVIIDGDGHVHEDAHRNFVDYHLEPRFRDRARGIPRDPVDRSVGGKYGKRHGDPAIQLADMDTEGIDVAVLYPTTLLGAARHSDPEFATALHRAYNDWLAEFCRHNPERLKGVAAVPMVAPEEAARELERCVTQLGFVGAMAHTRNPDRTVGDSCYDDLYSCAQQYDVPVSFHASGSEIRPDSRFDTFLAEHTLGHTHEQMCSAINLVYGGVLERFPRLRVGFLEGMVGWIPMLADRMDEEYEHRPFEAPTLTREPSAWFRSGRMFFGAEPEEWMIPTVINYLGSDATLLYSSDYPHWDGAFPNSTRKLAERTDLTDANKRNIFGENACRYYPGLAGPGLAGGLAAR
jgi:predicted TIM-barrel fold metal-dependent hydrolase